MSAATYELDDFAPPAPPAAETVGLAIGSALEHVEDHASAGVALLIEQYKGKPRIDALLRAMLDQIQETEDAAWSLYVLRNLVDATGDLLDQLGGIVGELRRGRVDDEYRRFVGVRILSNRSDGTIEDLYLILRALWPDFVGRISERYPAGLYVQIANPITAETPTAEVDFILGRSKPGAVSLEVGYTTVAESLSLIVDSAVSPFTVAGQKIGSSISGGGGAMWSVHRV